MTINRLSIVVTFSLIEIPAKAHSNSYSTYQLKTSYGNFKY
jgi:hypothetical protein